MKSKFTRGRAIAAAAATLTLALTGCAGGSADASGGDDVTLMLDVASLPKHAPFYSAVAQGFFEAEGINVEIQPGSGSSNTVTSVDTGKVDFGFADFGVTILNQGQGAGVKQVNLLMGQSAYAVLALPESGISDWEDLKGKSVATEGSGAMTAMWPLALDKLGFDESDVEVIHASGESKVPGLIAGQWDANLALFISDEPLLVSEGHEPTVLKWADIGISTYGNGIVASDAMIADDPDLVERFNRAVSQGFLWSCANPAEAAADYIADVPGFDQEVVERAIDAQCSLNWSSDNESLGYGQMTDEGVQSLITIAGDYLGLEDPSALAPGDVYTNEFITEITPDDTFEKPAAAATE